MRFLINTGFLLAANALGLIIADMVLDDFSLAAESFFIALAIFTVVAAVIRPFLMKMAMSNAEALMGGTALVAILIGLIATSVVSDGFNISGLDTWLLATMIVWIVSLLAGILLPMLILKRGVEKARANQA